MSQDIPEGFKITEIGLLPEEWLIVKLCDVCTLRNESINPNSVDAHNLIYVGLEHLIPSETSIRQWGKPDDVRSSKNMFYEGDILYGKLRPYLDKAAIAHINGICSTDILVFKTDNHEASNYFLANLIHTKSFLEYAKMTTTGVNHPRTSWSSLSEYRFAIPPLPEQRAIASVLSAIQEAKERTGAVIQATRELKKSLMKHLFSYGVVPLDEAENVPLKETEIGMVPEDWDVAKLEDTGDIITGTTPRTDVKEYYGNEYMFISPGDMGEYKYVDSASKWLSEEGLKVSRILPMDTVLVVCIGATIGKTSMTHATKSTTNQQINAIIANDTIYSHYLYYAISYRSDKLPSLSGGVAVPIINKSNFSKFTIPLPPLPIQQQIADILTAVDQKIEAEEGRSKALDELFKTLLSNLMTGSIRVNNMEI